MRTSWSIPCGAALALLGAVAASAEVRGDKPLPTLSAKLKAQVEAKEVAGAVVLVANAKRTLHLEAVGLADREAGTPMKDDAIFWIASMTKPVVGTAIMMLVEEGKLSIEDPVGKYVPELAHLKTADGTEYPLTIRQLLTHSSGLAEATSDESAAARTLSDLIPRFAAKPLQFVPGSKWAYCQSGINTAARIVEVVSGKSFPEFLQQRLFDPLGMKDTTFYLTPAQQTRLAKSYLRTPEGELKLTEIRFLQGKSPTDRDRYPAGNGGLFSTASDYGRFLRMVLNGGSLDGKRYLKPETVRQMTSLHSGELKTGFTPGNGWGIGWCLVQEPQGVSRTLSKGTFGHGGAYGTQAWADPERKLVYVIMVQRANFPNSDDSGLRKDVHEATAADLPAK